MERITKIHLGFFVEGFSFIMSGFALARMKFFICLLFLASALFWAKITGILIKEHIVRSKRK